MGNISAKPLTDDYGVYQCKKVHGGRGGKHHWHYRESGDKFKKNLKVWVSEATSVKEFESRKELQEIFGYFLNRRGVKREYKYNIPLDGIVKDLGRSILGRNLEIYFQDKALTSFPMNLPDYWDEIEKLDLSGNFLKEIPQEGEYKHLIMSGNPLTECLDKINVKVHFLDLSNCGLTTLTPSLFKDFEAMYRLNEEHTHSGDQLRSNVLYGLNLTGNPLSDESISLIEDYISNGYDLPSIDFDKDGICGLNSRVLARDVKEKIKIQEALEKERVAEEKEKLAEENNKLAEENKQAKINKLLSCFDIDNAIFLSVKRLDAIAGFLTECFPLSKIDDKFKKNVRQLMSKIIEEDKLANIIFDSISEDRKLTFNIIDEGFLLWAVEQGRFDGIPDDLVKKLRNLFTGLKIEKKVNIQSASSFAQWEGLLQDKTGTSAKKRCEKYLIQPSNIELIKLDQSISFAEKKDFAAWLHESRVWQQYKKRMDLAD